MGTLRSETQILYFWNNYPKLAVKNYTKGLWLGLPHFVRASCPSFKKITKIKQKDRYWHLFPCPLYALFQMECSLPQVLQKCPNKDIIFIMKFTNCVKLWENQRKAAWEATLKPCIFGINIPNWPSKLYRGLDNIFCHIFSEFREKNSKKSLK